MKHGISIDNIMERKWHWGHAPWQMKNHLPARQMVWQSVAVMESAGVHRVASLNNHVFTNRVG